MRKLAIALLGLLAACIVWLTMSNSGQVLLGTWSFTEAMRVDRGTYFRVKVDLAYKGEPQHFDIVVGCNVLDIAYKDGSGTHEVGLVPTVYGRRMSDGKGLVIRAPNACRGETTANGEVPADFLPLVVVYDDADTLGFGTAYMVDEAYDSPLSVLKAGRATVEAATRAEFVDFRKNGQPNLVTREQYHSAQPQDVVEKMGLKKVYPAFGRTCWSYSRSLVPEALRGILREFWPANRPKYWVIPEYKDLSALLERLHGNDTMRDDGIPQDGISGIGGSKWPDSGTMRKSGLKPIGPPRLSGNTAPSLYPLKSDVMAPAWPRDPKDWPAYVSGMEHVDSGALNVGGGAYRGFAYCYQRPGFQPLSEAANIIKEKPSRLTIDGISVAGAPIHWWFTLGTQTFMFELDKYIYVYTEFYLESTRGDV